LVPSLAFLVLVHCYILVSTGIGWCRAALLHKCSFLTITIVKGQEYVVCNEVCNKEQTRQNITYPLVSAPGLLKEGEGGGGASSIKS
jgi:hypothetical protein